MVAVLYPMDIYFGVTVYYTEFTTLGSLETISRLEDATELSTVRSDFPGLGGSCVGRDRQGANAVEGAEGQPQSPGAGLAVPSLPHAPVAGRA